MKVSLKDDRMPDGTELHVRGLGTLINGQSVEFSREEVARFEERRGLALEKAFDNDPRITVGGTHKPSKAPAEDDAMEGGE